MDERGVGVRKTINVTVTDDMVFKKGETRYRFNRVNGLWCLIRFIGERDDIPGSAYISIHPQGDRANLEWTEE